MNEEAKKLKKTPQGASLLQSMLSGKVLSQQHLQKLKQVSGSMVASLAGEFAGAAEQHAGEVRTLKGVIANDRAVIGAAGQSLEPANSGEKKACHRKVAGQFFRKTGTCTGTKQNPEHNQKP